MGSTDFYYPKFESSYQINTIQRDLGFHYGVTIQYNISEKLSIKTGLNYSTFNYKVITSYFDPKYGFGGHEDSLSFRNWNIPIMLKYSLFSEGNFKITPSLGYVISFLKGNRSSFYVFSYSLDSNKDYKLTMHSTQFNLGLEYLIKDKILITLEPYINWNFTEIDAILYKKNTISFGEILSINYKF